VPTDSGLSVGVKCCGRSPRFRSSQPASDAASSGRHTPGRPSPLRQTVVTKDRFRERGQPGTSLVCPWTFVMFDQTAMDEHGEQPMRRRMGDPEIVRDRRHAKRFRMLEHEQHAHDVVGGRNRVAGRCLLDHSSVLLSPSTVPPSKMPCPLSKLRTAAQAAWEIDNGPVPDGVRVQSRADEPACVRVDHLQLDQRTTSSASPSKKRSAPNSRSDVQRDASAIVEYGGEFQVCTEGFDISSHSRHRGTFTPFDL
jgi:hypothetical protein